MLENLSYCDFTPAEEINGRIAKLQAGMEAAGISYTVILQNVDLYYFTGSMQKSFLVVPVGGDPFFFVEKNVDRARIESPLDIITIKRDKDIKGILQDSKLLQGKAGFEFDVLPVAVYERWRDLLGVVDATDVSGLIKEIRTIKSPFEISQFKKSGAICEHVFIVAKNIIREGMREIDIDAMLSMEGRKFGHQGFLRMRGLNQEMMSIYVTHGRSGTIVSAGDVPISGTGVTQAIGQGSSFNVVQKDVPLLVDYGGGYNGYITDETRVYIAGELRDPFLKAYEVARDIIEETGQIAKEGVNAADIFRNSLKHVEQAGLEEYFMGHGLGKVGFIGHGLGLEINEMPVITPRHNITLKEGMVFAFEPKFIFPGRGAIGIEVDFIVRKNSLERVTNAPIDVVYV